MGVLSKITDQYSKLDSFLYDFVAAPAVVDDFFNRRHQIAPGVFDSLGTTPKILDIGCGGGQIAVRLADHFPSSDVFGVDLSKHQIKKANRRKFQSNRKNLHFSIASALDLPFADRTFDVVISVACLKHLPDKLKGLKEALRVLKPEGYLIFVEANQEVSEKQILNFCNNWNIPKFVTRFAAGGFKNKVLDKSVNVSELKSLVKGAGRDNLEVVADEYMPILYLRSRS